MTIHQDRPRRRPRRRAVARCHHRWATDLIVSVGYRTSELIKEAAAFVYDGLGGGARAKPDLWDALFNAAGGTNGQGWMPACLDGGWRPTSIA